MGHATPIDIMDVMKLMITLNSSGGNTFNQSAMIDSTYSYLILEWIAATDKYDSVPIL